MKFRFKISDPITFRQLNDACILLGVSVDDVLEDPLEALEDVVLKATDVIPFVMAVCHDPPLTQLEELEKESPRRLKEVGDDLACSFFSHAFLNYCFEQEGDIRSYLIGADFLLKREIGSRLSETSPVADLTPTSA